MEFIIIFVCLGLNGILAAVEMAFVTIAKEKLRELAKNGSRDAQRVLLLREKPERTLSVIQIGISAVGALAAATGGVGAESVIEPFLRTRLGLEGHASEVVALALVVLPYTYLSVVIGELVPKAVALRAPWKIVRVASRYFEFFERSLAPIVNLLEKSTRLVLRLIRPRWIHSKLPHDEGETLDLGRLTRQTRECVLNMIELERMRLGEFARPLSQTLAVDALEGAPRFEESTGVLSVLRELQNRGERLAIVMRHGALIGTVTTDEILRYVMSPVSRLPNGTKDVILKLPAARIQTHEQNRS